MSPRRDKTVAVAVITAVVSIVGTIATTSVTSWMKYDELLKAGLREQEVNLARELAKIPGVARAIVDLQAPGLDGRYSLPSSFTQTLTDEANRKYGGSLPKNPTPEDLRRLSDLGWKLFLLGLNDQAIQLQRDCLETLKNVVNKEAFRDVNVTVHNRLGQILRKTKDRDGALEYLHMACMSYASQSCADPQTIRQIVRRPEFLGERGERLFEVLNNIALVNRSKGELDLAKEYYELSDEIASRLSLDSGGFEQHGWNQNGLGLIALQEYYRTRSSDHLARARRHFEKAEYVFRGHTGSHPRGAVINHLALVDYLEGDYKSTSQKLRVVLRIWKDQLGPVSPDVEVTYRNLARAHDALAKGGPNRVGDLSEAAKWRAEAVATQRQRKVGLDIRLERHGAVYSRDGKDEWEVALSMPAGQSSPAPGQR